MSFAFPSKNEFSWHQRAPWSIFLICLLHNKNRDIFVHMNGLYLEGGGIFFFDIFKCSKKWVRLFMLLFLMCCFMSQKPGWFFLYRTQGICPLGGDFERNDKKTEYNFVIIGQVASKSFLNNKNITLKNLLGKFFRFSNKGVDLFLKQKKRGQKLVRSVGSSLFVLNLARSVGHFYSLSSPEVTEASFSSILSSESSLKL